MEVLRTLSKCLQIGIRDYKKAVEGVWAYAETMAGLRGQATRGLRNSVDWLF